MSDTEPNRAWIWGVVKQLAKGDRVSVETSSRARTLTVSRGARLVDRRPYRCRGLVVTLSGYGTTYTLEVPDEEGNPARLLYPSKPGLGEIVTDVAPADGPEPAIVADTTAADLGIPER